MAAWRGPASDGAYQLNRRRQLEVAAETMQRVPAELAIVTAADLTQGRLPMTVVHGATKAPRLGRHPLATSYPVSTLSHVNEFNAKQKCPT